jgi:hypothetical protein
MGLIKYFHYNIGAGRQFNQLIDFLVQIGCFFAGIDIYFDSVKYYSLLHFNCSIKT